MDLFRVLVTDNGRSYHPLRIGAAAPLTLDTDQCEAMRRECRLVFNRFADAWCDRDNTRVRYRFVPV